jgi:hypothetical protein
MGCINLLCFGKIHGTYARRMTNYCTDFFGDKAIAETETSNHLGSLILLMACF